MQASSFNASVVRVRLGCRCDRGRGARPRSDSGEFIGRAFCAARQARSEVLKASGARLSGDYVAWLEAAVPHAHSATRQGDF
jgi:hypothetical protein